MLWDAGNEEPKNVPNQRKSKALGVKKPGARLYDDP